MYHVHIHLLTEKQERDYEYLKNKRKACWVEGHEREVIGDDRETAEAAHGLKYFDSRQRSYADHQSLHQSIQCQHWT